MRVAYSVWVALIVALAGCEAPSSSLSVKEVVNSEDLHFLPTLPDSFPIAICLWDKVEMGMKPGIPSETEYLSTIQLGDHVYMLGDLQRVSSEKRTYMKVRDFDGKEGWVPSYRFGWNAHSAVIVKTVQMYRRPNPLMKKFEKLYPGDFIAVVEDENGWVKVMGMGKKNVGWIQKKPALSVQREDIRMAVLYQRAKSEKEPARRVSLLESLLQKAPEGSNFVDLIEGDLEESSKQLNNDEVIEGKEVQTMTVAN